jgi:hypothetical protein
MGDMMMRIIVFATAAFCVATAAKAEIWQGPGWYQVADSNFGLLLEAGPFADEDACRVTLRPADDLADYACRYFTDPPGLDDEL